MARLSVLVAVAILVLQAVYSLPFDGSQPRVYYAEMLTVPGGTVAGLAAFTDPAADLFHAVWYSISAQYGIVDFSLVEAESGNLVLQLSDTTSASVNSDWFDEKMSKTGNPILGSSLATFNMSFYAVKAVDHTTKSTVLWGQLRPLSQCQWLGVLSFDQLSPQPSTAPGQMAAANVLLSQSSMTTWDWRIAGRLDFQGAPQITKAWLYDTTGSADVQFCQCPGCSLCGAQYNYDGIGSTTGLSVVQLNLDLYNMTIMSSKYTAGELQGQLRRSPNPEFDSTCPGVTQTPTRSPPPSPGAASPTATPTPSACPAAVSASASRVIGSRTATPTPLASRGYGASNSRAPSGFPSDSPTPSLKRCACANTPPASLTCTKPSPFCLDYDPVNLCCCVGSWSCDVVPAATTSSSGGGGKKSAAALARTSPVLFIFALFFLLLSMLAL